MVCSLVSCSEVSTSNKTRIVIPGWKNNCWLVILSSPGLVSPASDTRGEEQRFPFIGFDFKTLYSNCSIDT